MLFQPFLQIRSIVLNALLQVDNEFTDQFLNQSVLKKMNGSMNRFPPAADCHTYCMHFSLETVTV